MRWIACLVSLAVAGCGVWKTETKESPATVQESKYKFDYEVSNAAPISLLRVFDDGGSTYFQFRNAPPEALVISAETASGEAVIPHERMGNYAVIRGVYRKSTIPSAAQTVVMRKLGVIAPMANVGPVVLPKPLAPVAMRPMPAASLPLAASATKIPVRRTIAVHRVRFARNRAALGPKGQGDLDVARAHLAHVAKIEIRVRPFYAKKPASLRLAQKRAQAIREALVKLGAQEAAITIEQHAAKDALVAEVALQSLDYEAVFDQTSPWRIGSTGGGETRAVPVSF